MNSVQFVPGQNDKNLIARAMLCDPRADPQTTPDVVRRLTGLEFETVPPPPSAEEVEPIQQILDWVFGPIESAQSDVDLEDCA